MFIPNKFTEFFRTLGVRSFLFLALAMLSVVLLCGFFFSQLYSSQKTKILGVGEKNTAIVTSNFEAVLVPLLEFVKISAYRINYMDEHTEGGVSADVVGKFLIDQNAVYSKIIDDSFLGIYSYFNGKFLPGIDWTPDENYHPVDRPWYKSAVSSPKQIVFVDPYLDVYTGSTVMTFATTLNDNRNVMAFDIRLDKIQKIIEDVSRNDGYDHMVVSDGGVVIAHSDVDMVGKVYDLSDGTVDNIYEYVISLLDEKDFSNGAVVEYGGINYVVYSRSIGDHWHVVGIADSAEYFSSLETVFIVSTITILFVLTVVAVVFIHIVFNKRKIEKLNENMVMLAEVYDHMYEFSLSANTCMRLCSNASEQSDVLGSDIDDAQIFIVSEMNKLVDDSSKRVLTEFVNLNTLPDRLASGKNLILEFLNHDQLWNRARFISSHSPGADNPDKILFLIENIDLEKREREKLIYLSETDPLTGILNRRSGESKIKSLIAGEKHGLYALFDADKFKSVNDSFGHDVGDKVIVAVAECLRKTFSNYDVVMRLGGDEFAVYVMSVTDRDAASALMRKLFNHIDKIVIKELGDFKINLSVGIAFFGAGRQSRFESLYREADFAMYESKKIHGNSVTFFDDLNFDFDDIRR